MSNYTKSTNFATKDNLTPGDPLKVVRGTEIDTEFNNISTAIATKTDNASAAITGGTITGITDLAVADGGTGASTAAGALNNLLPAQASAANKYLQSDGTNASWDAVSLSTADITGTLPVLNGGTGVTTSTGTTNVVLSNSPTLVTPILGTPTSATLTNATGLPISTGVSGLGTGVATFLGTPSSANLASAVTDETGSGALVFANSPTLVTPALGTPSALVGTNITGTASGLTAGNVTTNANLTGAVTSVGNASSLGSFTSAQLLAALTDETGTGSAVFATSPTLVTPILGTPTSATLTNATGLPIATGVSGLGTGVATFLATPSSANLLAALTDETGTGSAVFATSPTLVTPVLGVATGTSFQGIIGNVTPAAGAFTTVTASTAIGTASGGTGLGGATPFTSGGVVYASSTSALATGSAITFDGTNLILGSASPNFQGSSSIGSVTLINNSGGAYVRAYGGSHATRADFTEFANGATTSFINSAGNFGLAVIPSIFTVGKVIEVGTVGNAVFGVGAADMRITAGAYYDAAWKYAVTGSAITKYEQTTGVHTWWNAPSGTAGNNATFTQAMTLDASGNLMVGGTTALNTSSGRGNITIDGTSNSILNFGVGGVAKSYLFQVGGNFIITNLASAGGYLGFENNGAERMRLPATGGVQAVTTISVGNATPSTSGAGITFPATQSASSDANTLDDYEEGTWTPTFSLDSGSATTTSAVGNYVKIGKQVSVTINVTFSVPSAADINEITGLPFTVENTQPRGTGAIRENANTGFTWLLRANNGFTTAMLRRYDGAQAITNGMQFIGLLTYFAA